MTIRERLEKDKDIIFQRIKDGDNATNIARTYGCNGGSVWYFLDSYGIKSNKPAVNKGVANANKQKILDMFDNGVTIYQISKEFGLANCTLCRYLQRWGRDTSRGAKLDKTKTPLCERKEEMIALYEEGFSQNEVGELMGFNGPSVCRTLKESGVQARPIAKYTLNHHFFDTVDTEEKAYLLGWFHSDGNVMPSGKCRISIQEDDIEIVEWAKKVVEYTGPLYHKIKEGNRKLQVEFCVQSQILYPALCRLGCVPNKSMILQFPTEDQVPKHLIHHFVGGFMDGDGSVGSGVMITTTYDFLMSMKDILPCEITNIYQRYKNRPLRKSSHRLFIGRTSEIIKFYNWVYKDATVWLPRKRNKFSRYIKTPIPLPVVLTNNPDPNL